jgi:hypothetical protein
MGERARNIRHAMEAEGATPEEISETLEEIQVQEEGRDPRERGRRSGIPEKYLCINWDDIEMDGRKKSIEVTRRWAESYEPRRAAWKKDTSAGLYLWSDGDGDEDETGFGTGKTWIAAAAAEHLLGQGLRVRWLTVSRLMTNLNLGFSNPMYEDACHRVREPRRGEVIVLDDIDKQPPTERNIQPIFALVNDCTNNEIPLLITANRHIDALQEDWGARFGHAAASRIIEHCLDVEVKGRDRRLPA